LITLLAEFLSSPRRGAWLEGVNEPGKKRGGVLPAMCKGVQKSID